LDVRVFDRRNLFGGKKHIKLYGDDHRRYMKDVPSIIPKLIKDQNNIILERNFE